MKRKQNNYGLTLVEILVAVVIIAILAVGLYIGGNYLETQSKIKLTQSTIETLCTALEQYHDFYRRFPFQADENYHGEPNLVSDVGAANVMENSGCTTIASDYNDIYASGDALYYFLNQIPASRKIVDSINHSLIANKDYKGKEYFVSISGQCYPLIRIIDPWKCPFRYTYTSGDNFPVITSAGPNGTFDPPGAHIDDISSRQ